MRVDGHLDPALSRWRWLIKWLLARPHVVVLVFLWLAFVVLSVVAFFAILFTERYPRRIFWWLRVAAYAGLLTDAYPPFRLDSGPDEPEVSR